jgi:hypothetical protein
MQITLAFKKNDPAWYAKLVRWYTKSKYSHVELIIEDKWISISDSKDGVHIYDLEPLHTSWDYVPVEVPADRLEDVWRFIDSQVGKKYDWAGIFFTQFLKISDSDAKNKWFCSEFVCQVLKEFQIECVKEFDCANLSPRDLYLLFKC